MKPMWWVGAVCAIVLTALFLTEITTRFWPA